MRMPKWQDELVLKDSVSTALEKIDKNRIELLRLIIPEEESQKENEEKHD